MNSHLGNPIFMLKSAFNTFGWWHAYKTVGLFFFLERNIKMWALASISDCPQTIIARVQLCTVFLFHHPPILLCAELSIYICVGSDKDRAPNIISLRTLLSLQGVISDGDHFQYSGGKFYVYIINKCHLKTWANKTITVCITRYHHIIYTNITQKIVFMKFGWNFPLLIVIPRDYAD